MEKKKKKRLRTTGQLVDDNPRLQKPRDPELIWKDIIYTLD